jgi:hypothetical protein
MIDEPQDFFSAITAWVLRTPELKSAVLYGSSARQNAETTTPRDPWSDFDILVVASDPLHFESLDWSREIPGSRYCFQVARPATAGVCKVTAVFANGQIDLVIVPERALRLARLAMRLGLHGKMRRVQIALNELSTTLHSGFRFVKSEPGWDRFFTRVAAEIPCVRVSNEEANNLAQAFLCDLLWMLQKVERRELIAAQHVLHDRLGDTNLRLMRELRLRRGQPLPSFSLGRRLETLAKPEELKWVQISARLSAEELHRAAWECFAGLKALMAELEADWKISPETEFLFTRYRAPVLLPK